MRLSELSFLLFASITAAQNTKSSPADVAAAAATALTLSRVSHVKGKAFDRIAIIWCENTDYDLAAGDREYNAADIWEVEASIDYS